MWEKPENPELTQMSSIYSEKMLFSPTTHGPACAPTSDEARLKDFRFHAVNKWNPSVSGLQKHYRLTLYPGN